MAQTVEDALVVRMEASLRKFERQMAQGRKVATEAAVGAEKAWQRSGTRISANANNAARGLGRLNNVSGAGRFVLTNTANQLGDIAVQLESGTNGFRVMGQQLPQILGGFGALGGTLGIIAPLLGTVAAIGLPIAGMLFAMGRETKEADAKITSFADKLKEAESAISSAEKAMIRASEGGLEQLQDRYGIVTEKVRELAAALAEIEERAAVVAIGSVLDDALGGDFQSELDKVFGAVGTALTQVGSEAAAQEIEQVKQAIADLNAEIVQFQATGQAVPPQLTEQLALMNEELAALEGRIGEIGGLEAELIVPVETLTRISDLKAQLDSALDEGNFLRVADLLNEIRNIIVDTGVEIEQGVIDKLVQAEDQARGMADAMGVGRIAAEDLAAAAGTIAGAIDPAIEAAFSLVGALQQGVGLLNTLRGAQGILQRVADGAGEFGQQILDAAENPIAPNSSLRPRLPSIDASFGASSPRRRSGGGGGGGRSGAISSLRELSEAAKAAQQVMAQVNRESVTYADVVAELNGLLAQGKISQEQFNEAVDVAGERFDEASEKGGKLGDDLAGMFSNAVTGAESLTDALGQVLDRLGDMLINEAFQALFGGGGSGSGGGLFKSIGSLFGFEGGGFTGKGSRSGGVDGRGGFPAILHPNETVIDHTRGQSGGGGRIEVVARVENGSIVQDVREISGQVAVRVMSEGLSSYDKSTLPRSLDRIQKNPRRRG